jgi:16S rRNA (guanine966-N2)-methyltransferase
MRIISGKFGGRRIITPKGMTARPTSGRAREALFSLLAARGDVQLEGARVIDLFAGAGTLGFEALSRGAAFCLFVETDAAARGALRESIETFGLFAATRIHRRSAIRLGEKPAGLGGPFDLAFLDPPYGEGLCEAAMAALAAGHWLKPGAVVTAEQGAKETPAAPAGFSECDRRRYGAAQIGVYRFSP